MADSLEPIWAVLFYPSPKVQVKPSVVSPVVESETPAACVYCQSKAVVKGGLVKGKARTVQRFLCRACKKSFTLDLGFKKMKNDPKAITAALDAYFRGLSLRDVRDHLAQFYGVKVHETSVLRWVEEYSRVISGYVDALAPQLSDTWHVDEVFQNMRGGVKVKGGRGMAFLWNVMDRKTRFLVAQKLSAARDVERAKAAFTEAVKVAHDSEPEKMFADSLNAYPAAIPYAPFAKDPELIARAGIVKPHANNNRIERINGTQRERFKVQRGWKSTRTAVPEGNRVFYNFVRPHMALPGRPPQRRRGLT